MKKHNVLFGALLSALIISVTFSDAKGAVQMAPPQDSFDATYDKLYARDANFAYQSRQQDNKKKALETFQNSILNGVLSVFKDRGIKEINEELDVLHDKLKRTFGLDADAKPILDADADPIIALPKVLEASIRQCVTFHDALFNFGGERTVKLSRLLRKNAFLILVHYGLSKKVGKTTFSDGTDSHGRNLAPLANDPKSAKLKIQEWWNREDVQALIKQHFSSDTEVKLVHFTSQLSRMEDFHAFQYRVDIDDSGEIGSVELNPLSGDLGELLDK